MNKSKILAVALSAALVGSMAAAASLSASAVANVEQIKDHSVGVTGSFNGWGNGGEADVAMTDDGSGVYVGVIDIDNVTADMIVEHEADDGTGSGVKNKTGKKGITFKVRLDGSWDDSWGEYEPAYERTWNSQTDCCAEVSEGDAVKITVKLDTTQNHPDSPDAGDAPNFEVIPVTYTVEKKAASTESSTESKAESSTESKAESSTAAATTSSAAESSAPASTADTTTPATGDTTSAVALVAVVLASLGASVVMTKKASVKD